MITKYKSKKQSDSSLDLQQIPEPTFKKTPNAPIKNQAANQQGKPKGKPNNRFSQPAIAAQQPASAFQNKPIENKQKIKSDNRFNRPAAATQAAPVFQAKPIIEKPKSKPNNRFNRQNNQQPANTSSKSFVKPVTEMQLPNTLGKPLSEKLRVIVLGGLEEVGRNMTVLEYGNDIIIIDMGLQFPEEDMYGIDYIIPDISYLKDKLHKIKGVIITHGHYDHIGGIPHLMGELGNPPMFMGKLTAGIIRRRVKEYPRCPELKITEITDTHKIQLGQNFRLEFLRVNHSIPDCFAIIAHTPAGTVLHTGDFKIDYTPVNDKPADLQRIAQIGSQGVTLLMSDSTDATSPGYQVSESAIGVEMGKFFEDIEGRIIIGTFASQLSRMQKLFEIAEKLGRRIYLAGRSINDNVEIAHQIGYLKFNPRTIIQSDDELMRLPADKTMIIGTGAQGENNAFLMKVVLNEHKSIKLNKTDTVIFSSSIIPGNERSIATLRDLIVRTGAKVINYKMMDVHAGGHAKAEDLKLLMRLLKPKFFMPIEANHYMLQAHADLARQVGIPEANIFVGDNGQVLEVQKMSKDTRVVLTKEKVPTDYVMVDGLGVGDVSEVVLRDRKAMAEDGMIVIITTIDNATGDLIGSPDIISRGFIYMKENQELIQKTRIKIKNIIKERPLAKPADDDYIKNKVRNDIGQFLFNQTKRRPMVLPVVIKV
ncbi:MAG: ribonuclease J [Candidatus Falkowbacteria bacterium]